MSLLKVSARAALLSSIVLIPFISKAAHVSCIDEIIAAYCPSPLEVKRVGFSQSLGGTPQPGPDYWVAWDGTSWVRLGVICGSHGTSQNDLLMASCSAGVGTAAPSGSKPRPVCPMTRAGSIIDVDSLTVGESVDLVGSPFNLVYNTSRVFGRPADYKIHIPLTGNDISKVSQVHLKIEYAGITFQQTFSTLTPNMSYDFVWDGLDVNGNPVPGSTMARVTVGETAAGGGTDYPLVFDFMIGTWDVRQLGIGGWTLSGVHFYDVARSFIYFGDGTATPAKSTLQSNGNLMAVSPDGDEVYIFTPQGRHIETKHALTGATKFTITYDSAGRLTYISDAYVNRTRILRDANGKATGVQGPYGAVTQLGFDSQGRLTSLTNPKSEVFSATYQGTSGLMATFTKPGGQVSTFSYDADGYLASDQHSSGYGTSFVQNLISSPRTINMTTAQGRVTTIAITDFNASYSRKETDPNGVIKTFTKDPGPQGSFTNSFVTPVSTGQNSQDVRFGDMLPVPSSLTVYGGGQANVQLTSQAVTYTAAGAPFGIDLLTTTVTRNGKSGTIKFNGATKTITTTSPLGRTSSTALDSFERPISVQYANLTPIQIAYDTRGRTSQLTSGARQQTLTYDTIGRLKTVTNSLGEVTGYTFNSADRLITKTLPDLRVIQYVYDSNGNLASVTPPGRSAHSFTYNAHELTDKYTPPALATPGPYFTQYSYNLDRQLTKITRPDGQIIDFNYGATTGYLNSIATPQGNYTVSAYAGYGPDSISSITSPDNNIGINISRDALFITQVQTYQTGTGNLGIVNYTYNSDHRLASDKITGSNGGTSTISYTYDNDGVLTGAGDLTLSIDPTTGFVSGTALASSTDAYTYNSFGEVMSYEAKYGSTIQYSVAYTRDDLGRIVTKTETIGGVTDVYAYTYDVAGRLTDITKNGAAYSHSNYDTNSNRTSGTVRGVGFTATYDSQDRMTTYNTKTYTYNLNGDLHSAFNSATNTTTTYSYDVFGNVKSISMPGKTAGYLIDGFNRRVARIWNGSVQARYVYYDQYRMSAELNPAGVINKRFVYATKRHVPEYMVRAGVRYRLVTDHLGSVRLVVNTNDGTIAQRIDYDEYGRVVSDTNPGFQPFAFAGGLFDIDMKLIRFGARDYDVETGRWTSKDPIRFAGGDTNLYGYVLQDPVNFIDPSGKCPWCIGAAVGAVSSGATAYLAGGSARDIAIAAGVGAVTGAATMGVSAFTTSATGIIAANSLIGLVGNVGTQLATGTSLNQVNVTSAIIGGVAGGVGGAAGLAAGNMAFFGTGVIGNPLGMALSRSREFWASTLIGTAIGTGVESGANMCR